MAISTKNDIIIQGKKLAILDPESKALKAARVWWSEGCQVLYSYQDFDVLNSLTSAISTIEIHNANIAAENYDIALTKCADKHLDAALARGEAFSEGLCGWAISMAQQEIPTV